MENKILITGSNSYVGTSFMKWISINDESIECHELSVRGNDWKKHDFSIYTSIIHVAGIAHVNSKKFSDDDYYKINTNLAIEVAQKAKADGVPHFVFLSSIIVYNDSDLSLGTIQPDTIPLSNNAYGDSKIKAEKGIESLSDSNFKVAILRPPMIYGPRSKGNYPKLAKLARITPFFPKYSNERSMLFIDNLSIYLYTIIVQQQRGLFFPQNTEYVETSKLVKSINLFHKKRQVQSSIFNPFIKLAININVVNKVFGNLKYDKSLTSVLKPSYELITLEDSVHLTEAPNV